MSAARPAAMVRDPVCPACNRPFAPIYPGQRVCAHCRDEGHTICWRCGALFTVSDRERLCPKCCPLYLPAVADYLQHIYVAKDYAVNSVKAYGRDLSVFTAFLDRHHSPKRWTWRRIKPEAIKAFIATQHANGLGGRSIRRMLAPIRALFDHLIDQDDKHGWTNPCDGISGPHYIKREGRCLSLDEVGAVLRIAEEAASRGGFLELREWSMAEMYYSTGARLSELIGLDIRDMELADGRAEVNVLGKGRKRRLIPLGGPAVKAIRQYLPARERMVGPSLTPAVFVTARANREEGGATRIGHREVQRRQSALFDAAGVEGASVHSYRHSFCTHLMKNAADIRSIQELAGHESIAATQTYLHHNIPSLVEQYHKAHPLADTLRYVEEDHL